MTAKQVGSETDDTFGNLLQFTEDHDFSDLMHKHNDPEDPYHFDLFEFVVLGGELRAQRDIVRITFSSPTLCASPTPPPGCWPMRYGRSLLGGAGN